MTLFRGTGLGRNSGEPKDPNRFPKVPSEEGAKLMQAGVFGSNDYDVRPKQHIARRILEREIGAGDRIQRKRENGVLAQVSKHAINQSSRTFFFDEKLMPLLIFYALC